MNRPVFLKRDSLEWVQAWSAFSSINDRYPDTETNECLGTGRAAYSPTSDIVPMPTLDRFEQAEEFYSVLFHELTHWTGHRSRLDRFKNGQVAAFGSDTYGREELVAELGAAFLNGEAGIVDQTVETSAAYIDGWLKKIRKDVRLVVTAAAQAQKAADLILDRKYDTQGGEA